MLFSGLTDLTVYRKNTKHQLLDEGGYRTANKRRSHAGQCGDRASREKPNERGRPIMIAERRSSGTEEVHDAKKKPVKYRSRSA